MNKDKVNKMQCPKCGADAIVTIEDSTQRIKCTNCDYDVVTTFIPDIEIDETLYTIKITSGNYSLDFVKSLSKITTLNFISIKKMLDSNSFEFSSNAITVKELKELCISNSINYSLYPNFKY